MTTRLNNATVVAEGTTEPRSLADRFGDTISTSDFSNLVTGSDWTLAVQAALDTNAKYVYIDNECVISSTLTSAVDDRSIISRNGRLIGATSDIEILHISGDNSKTHVEIDGSALASTGLKVTGNNFFVSNCNIYNLFGDTVGAFGVHIEGDIGGIITHNVIGNIDATDNSMTGDAIGACRAVYITHTAAKTQQVIVSDNTIDGVYGEEGDAIQIICFDGTFPFLDGNAIISDNAIRNCNRRAVKIQASNVLCEGNKHNNSLTLGQLPNALQVYDIISSNDVIVQDNTADARIGFSGINSSGQSDNILTGNVIKGNTIRVGTTSQVGMFLRWNDGLIVSDNKIDGGINAIGMQNCVGCDISNNKVSGGDGDEGIVLEATATNCNVQGNVMLGGNRGFFIQNGGPNNFVTDNKVINSTSTGELIRPLSTAAGSLYANNYNTGAGAVIFFNPGDVNDQFVLDHRNTGPGSTSSPGVMFTTDIPSTEQSNSRHNDGDVSFKRDGVQGGKVGWVCVAGGTPGVWKEFGVVDA